jgi:hypothetical protein
MSRRTRIWTTLLVLVATPRTEAGKVPLSPEELQTASALIVVGRVQAHRTEDHPQDDGSVTRYVDLTVLIDEVTKGDAKTGDTIEVRCWVVVKEPRDGIVWDGGHDAVPADGGKARFFLTGRPGGVWSAIYPNGVDLLDQTPPLQFEREKANPIEKATGGIPLWLLAVGAGTLVGVIGGLWLFIRRSKREPVGP